jgi:hypothetical protein
VARDPTQPAHRLLISGCVAGWLGALDDSWASACVPGASDWQPNRSTLSVATTVRRLCFGGGEDRLVQPSLLSVHEALKGIDRCLCPVDQRLAAVLATLVLGQLERCTPQHGLHGEISRVTDRALARLARSVAPALAPAHRTSPLTGAGNLNDGLHQNSLRRAAATRFVVLSEHRRRPPSS